MENPADTNEAEEGCTKKDMAMLVRLYLYLSKSLSYISVSMNINQSIGCIKDKDVMLGLTSGDHQSNLDKSSGERDFLYQIWWKSILLLFAYFSLDKSSEH